MSYQSLILTIYQHTNAGNPADPNIGFWVCAQPNAAGGKPTSMAAATLAALGATAGQPYATEALAQAALQLVVNYQAQQLALETNPATNPGSNTLVYGPITT